MEASQTSAHASSLELHQFPVTGVCWFPFSFPFSGVHNFLFPVVSVYCTRALLSSTIPGILSVFAVASRHLECTGSFHTPRLVTEACPLGGHLKSLNIGLFPSFISVPGMSQGLGTLLNMLHGAGERGFGE